MVLVCIKISYALLMVLASDFQVILVLSGRDRSSMVLSALNVDLNTRLS